MQENFEREISFTPYSDELTNLLNQANIENDQKRKLKLYSSVTTLEKKLKDRLKIIYNFIINEIAKISNNKSKAAFLSDYLIKIRLIQANVGLLTQYYDPNSIQFHESLHELLLNTSYLDIRTNIKYFDDRVNDIVKLTEELYNNIKTSNVDEVFSKLSEDEIYLSIISKLWFHLNDYFNKMIKANENWLPGFYKINILTGKLVYQKPKKEIRGGLIYSSDYEHEKLAMYLVHELEKIDKKDEAILINLFSGNHISGQIDFKGPAKILITLFYHLRDDKLISNKPGFLCNWISKYFTSFLAYIEPSYIGKLLRPASTERVSNHKKENGEYVRAEFIDYVQFIKE